jgi:maltooligosyltrehalose trehalohydrolase
MSDDFHHTLHTVLTGERAGYYGDFGAPADLVQSFTNAFVYDGRYSRFRDRRHGRPATGLSGHRFFGYLQNHDQIGNRAQGERSSHLLSPERLKIAAASSSPRRSSPCCSRREVGRLHAVQYFTIHEDPELGRAVREGRRAEFSAFGWSAEEVPDRKTRHMRAFAARLA